MNRMNDERNAPAATIIVPVYQAERYLPRCVESILGQSCPDFELLLIDDGSTDGSGALCDRFAAEDARVRVIHQANQGVTRTRERAASEARGRYLLWVDADDWIEGHLLEDVLAAYDATGADIILYGSEELDEGRVVRVKAWTPRSLTEWQRQAINGAVNNLWSYAAPRALWEGETAPPEMARAAADGYMTVRLFMKARAIEALPGTYYHYQRGNEASITHTFTGRRYQGNAWSWYYRLGVCREHFPGDVAVCVKKSLSAAVKAWSLSLVLQDLTEDERTRLETMLRDLGRYAIHGRLRDRLLRWAILHNHPELCRRYAKRKLAKVRRRKTQSQ